MIYPIILTKYKHREEKDEEKGERATGKRLQRTERR